MFCYSVCAAALLLCGVALATDVTSFDVTKKRVEHIDLTDKDIVTAEDVDLQLRDNKQQQKFIGDLTIGERLADENIFRRSVEIANPTDQVYSSAIMLNVDRGTIHYLSVTNDKNSYAVACDEPYSLGTSRISFNVRVPPNTKSQLRLLVAAH